MSLSETFLFLRQALSHRYVGALLPTSPWNVRRILKDVNCAGPRTIVEYGPGTGVFTRRLLHLLSEDSKVIAIECNRRFLRVLHAMEKQDRRLTVVEDDALEVRTILRNLGIPTIDAAISGIPFSILSQHKARTLAEDTCACLTAKGRFLVYQCTLTAQRPLRDIFPSVHRYVCPWNLPPLIVFDAQKMDKSIDGHPAHPEQPHDLHCSISPLSADGERAG